MLLCSLLFAASMSPCFYRVLGCEYCCDNHAGTDSMVMVSVMLSYIVTSDSMGTLQKRLSLCCRTLIKLSPGISNLSQLLFSSVRSANANAVNDMLLHNVNGGKKVIARFEAPVTEPHHLFLRCNIN